MRLPFCHEQGIVLSLRLVLFGIPIVERLPKWHVVEPNLENMRGTYDETIESVTPRVTHNTADMICSILAVHISYVNLHL